VDISEEQVQIARAQGTADVELADLRDVLRALEGTLDLVIARDILEHFPRQELFEILRLVRRALCPGGRILAQVPNGQGLFAGSIIHGDITHESAFTRSSALQLFGASGFDRVDTYDCGPTPHNLRSTLRWVGWGIVEATLRLAHAAEAGSPAGHFTRNLIVVAYRPTRS
jgi:SAM-dependent methyltransferase